MSNRYAVRVGALAQIGHFTAVDATRYARGQRVITRTARGLELGEVLAPLEGPSAADTPPDGQILRPTSVEDELLAERLHRNRLAAIAACEKRLAELNLPAVLLDAEQLFDGRTLYFYFLGNPPDGLDAVLGELAQSYEAVAQLHRFAELLIEGCGPGCGTDQAAGGACHGCTNSSNGNCATHCAVAALRQAPEPHTSTRARPA